MSDQISNRQSLSAGGLPSPVRDQLDLQSPPLVPTYKGYLGSTLDALILHELLLSGRLCHVPRRPHDRERADLIKSGNIFIYEENASGIKRWTDGISWSPSRILDNFLVYRELNEDSPVGEKKKAFKKVAGKRPSNAGLPSSTGTNILSQGSGASEPILDDPARPFIGSLTDSYDFKENGLIKKTISIPYRGIVHHIVSYYTLDDAMGSKFMRPSADQRFATLVLRSDILSSNNFRIPLEEMLNWGTTTPQQMLMMGFMPVPQVPQSELLNHGMNAQNQHSNGYPTTLSNGNSVGAPVAFAEWAQQPQEHYGSVINYGMPTATFPAFPNNSSNVGHMHDPNPVANNYQLDGGRTRAPLAADFDRHATHTTSTSIHERPRIRS